MDQPNRAKYDEMSRRVYGELARRPQKALRIAEMGIASARREKSSSGLACMFLARAHALREIGSYKKAITDYDRAASIFRRYGEKVDVARTVIGKIDALDQLGRYKEALRIAAKARRTFQNSQLQVWEAKVNANTGNIYHRLGKYSTALRYYDLAYSVLSRTRPLDGFVVQFNQATIHLCQGEPAPAFAHLKACISYFDKQELSSFLGRTYYNLAYADYLLGKYQDSLRNLSAARVIFIKLRDNSFLASCYLDESELYFRLNRLEESSDAARRARRKFLKLRMPYEVAETNEMLGGILLRGKKRPQDAIAYLREAKRYFRHSGNRVKCAELDLRIGFALAEVKQPAKALIHVRNAYSVFARHKIYTRMLSSLTAEAGIHAQMELWDRAALSLRKARTWIRKVRPPWVLFPYYQLLGTIESKLGIRSAIPTLEQAIKFLEQMRVEIPSEDLRVSYLRDKMSPYQELIDQELRTGNVSRAFQYSERARSRVLLDFLEGSLSFAQNSEHALKLSAELNALKNESWRRSISGRLEVPAFREKRILQIVRRMQSSGKSPAIASISLEEIQNSLDTDHAVVSYYWIEDRLNAFVIHRREIRAFRDIASSRSLRAAFQLLRFQIERKRFDGEAPASRCFPHLETLYSGLIEPLSSLLRKFSKWTMIPHKWLHAFPFQCLRNQEGYLVDQHQIHFAPSVSVYLRRSSEQEPTPGKVLLLGYADQNAPFIEEEIREASSVYPSAMAFTGKQATSEALVGNGPQCGLIHIAGHGRFLPAQPFFSGILLADGWLTLPQIYQLSLKARLVTLSGCETGGQEILDGDELLGLIRAFLFAGAESLLVSLWRISDQSTAYFMKQFYSELSSGHSKIDSWRKALILTREKWNHPYHWGAFQLIC